jgi:hypothetical protein
MANPGRKKGHGPVDKAVNKLRKQNVKLRKRITKDMSKLSADAKIAVGLEERLRRLEAQIGNVTALVPGAAAPARRAPRTTRRRTSTTVATRAQPRSSRTSSRTSSPRSSSASSRTSNARSSSRSTTAGRRASRTKAA